MTERVELACKVLSAVACRHPDKTWLKIGGPALALTARPLLAQNDGDFLVEASHVD